MFVWRASAILREISSALPALHQVLANILHDSKGGSSFSAALKQHFAQAPSISIDHGVLEKSQNLFMVPGEFGWSDVGSWDAVYDISEKDENRNSTQGNVVAVDCRNSLIRSHDRLVAVVDMEGVSVIETTDAVLVMPRGASQKVRTIVEALSKGKGTEHILHVTVNRPWGSYTVLEEGPGFKIKRIEVAPGGRLSLQRHAHRSEHWVVTAGEATVTSGDSVSRLKPNESAFIPIGTIHRLENLGTTPLQIIEVQVGSYVGEDDIQRFDDKYGRTGQAEFPT
jgi:mannose-1-phosphate guanylyltransferase/mannose-6-phosphate isomerase